MRVPPTHGGAGVTVATVAEVFRLISAADPAIGQIPQNHVQFVDTLILYGSAEQQRLFLPQVLPGARLGNALSERGGRTARDWTTRLARRPGGGHRLDGRKFYATGALTAQSCRSSRVEEDGTVAIAYVPRDAPGLSADQDWNAFGQRGTFSGTVTLDDVHVEEPGSCAARSGARRPTPTALSASSCTPPSTSGIARGALEDGSAFLRERARPWREAGVDRAADDPQLLQARRPARDAGARRRGTARDAAPPSTRPTRRPGDLDAIAGARLQPPPRRRSAATTALEVATAIFDFSGASAADRAPRARPPLAQRAHAHPARSRAREVPPPRAPPGAPAAAARGDPLLLAPSAERPTSHDAHGSRSWPSGSRFPNGSRIPKSMP